MAKTEKPAGEYAVGYGKPPKQTRFAKGQSGNPNGRPKGKRNLATVLHSVMEEKVTIVEHGQKKQVTKLEAALKQLVNKSASGDLPSLRLLMQLVPGVEGALEGLNSPTLSDEHDRQVLAEMLKRMQPAPEPGTSSHFPENTGE